MVAAPGRALLQFDLGVVPEIRGYDIRADPTPYESVINTALIEDIMSAKHSTHVRLPARSEAVAGPEKIPGQPPKAPPVADPRTASQDPIKPTGLKP
jgi:hypothetical protein